MTLNIYPWKQYYSFKKLATFGNIKLNADTFKVILLDNTYTVDLTQTKYSDVSGSELPTLHGYTVGGFSLGQSFWTQFGSTDVIAQGFFQFQGIPITWTASGGDLTAKYAVLYDFTDAVTTKGLVGITALNTVDGVDQDVVVQDGLTLALTITPNNNFDLR